MRRYYKLQRLYCGDSERVRFEESNVRDPKVRMLSGAGSKGALLENDLCRAVW